MGKVSLRSYKSWAVPISFELPPGIDSKLDVRWRAFKYGEAYPNPIMKRGVYEFELDGFLHRAWIDMEGWVHRDDGPAMELINGRKQWFFRGFIIFVPGYQPDNIWRRQVV